jgi:4-amino-4-deoxy-L-arabinose transferase-like glycosyltransferase
MENVYWGIPVVITCLAGYIISWRLARQERYALALTLLVLCGLILRVYTSADLVLHDWDERYHALVAKNLTKHFLVPTLFDNPVLPYDYTDWTNSHVWLHKQPMALWLIAISIKLFGLHAFVVRIPSILLTTVAIKLSYDIAREWYGRQVAFLTAFLFSIHGLIIELASGRAGTDHIDAIFLFFIVLSVWVAVYAVRRRTATAHLLLGVVIGLAVLTKWLPALIAVPIWSIIAYPYYKGQRGKMLAHFVCLVIGLIVVALPWQLYILQVFPREAHYEISFNSRHLFHKLEAHEGGFFFHFDHLRMKYGELVYVPIAWYTWHGLRSRRAVDYAVLLLFWGTYLFFSIAATKMEAYTVIAAPAVFMITAIAVLRLYEMVKSGSRYRYLLIVGICGLIGLPIRYTIERVKPFTFLERNPYWNVGIEELRQSPDNAPTTVISECRHPTEVMFFTKCIAYEKTIDAKSVEALKAKGYHVIVSDGY